MHCRRSTPQAGSEEQRYSLPPRAFFFHLSYRSSVLLISLHFVFEYPCALHLLSLPFSSKFGVSLANCVGVIDSDYRGEVKISVINHSDEPYTVKNGERIAQLVIMPVDLCEYGLCDELDDTERGTGGFGSTGRM